jgi:hypothetical protein
MVVSTACVSSEKTIQGPDGGKKVDNVKYFTMTEVKDYYQSV